MDTQACTTGGGLENLLALVEKAVGVIERLQAENEALTMQLRLQEAELKQTSRQIGELEHAAAMLRKDAQWCRWFRNRYGGPNFSTFFLHIENEYFAEHPEAKETETAAHAKGHAEIPSADSESARAA